MIMFNKVDLYEKTLSNKQLEIYYHYLGDLINKSPFSSPFRIDNNPSCKLYEWNNNIYFKDFGNSDYKNLSWKQFIATVYNTSIDKAIILCYESLILGIIHSTILDTPIYKDYKPTVYSSTSAIDKIIIEEREWSKSDINYWNLPAHYLTYHNIIPTKRVAYYKNNVLEQQTNLNHHYRNPTYAYYYQKGKYKIYKPLDKNDNKWRNNIGNIIDEDDNIVYNKYILCTSKKDRIVLQYLLEKLSIKHIGTISYQSETSIPDIKYNLIGIIPDNDEAGREYASKISTKYNTRIIELDNYKDIFEYFKSNKRQLLQWIITNLAT